VRGRAANFEPRRFPFALPSCPERGYLVRNGVVCADGIGGGGAVFAFPIRPNAISRKVFTPDNPKGEGSHGEGKQREEDVESTGRR
jgi:hypothetical protein